jgi:hypothetical protein
MRESRKRVVFAVVLWALVTAATAATSSCYTHNCDGTGVDYGENPGEGHMLNANTWESNPIDGDWLDFSRQRAYYFDLKLLGNRPPQIIVPYISAEKNPLATGDNFTIGSGNLTELSNAQAGYLTVHNGTCADYFLRVVVIAADNGSELDAGDTDANDTNDAGSN